jgi:hypothetical protein
MADDEETPLEGLDTSLFTERAACRLRTALHRRAVNDTGDAGVRRRVYVLCGVCFYPIWVQSDPAKANVNVVDHGGERRLCGGCEEFRGRFPDVFTFFVHVLAAREMLRRGE